jgi:hypothetical protein
MGDKDDSGRRLDARFADWDARLDRVDAQRRHAAEVEAEVVVETTEQPAPGGHILFVPSPSGYELVERDGTTPSTGEEIELAGREGRYAVTRVVRSPLPDDRRRCAYLELT